MPAPRARRTDTALPGLGVKLGDDHLLDLSLLGRLSDTALTSERAIELQANGLPNTFVPGRNLLFLTFAATLAYRRSATVLVGGMCETDHPATPTAATTPSSPCRWRCRWDWTA